MIKSKASTTSKITVFLKNFLPCPPPKNEAELEIDFAKTHAEHCNRKRSLSNDAFIFAGVVEFSMCDWWDEKETVQQILR